MTRKLLSFTSTLSNPLCVRILALCLERKVAVADLPIIFPTGSAELSAALKSLKKIGLLEQDAKAGQVKVKKKIGKLLDSLFEHLKLTGVKDTTLRADAERAKRLRASQRLAQEVIEDEKKS